MLRTACISILVVIVAVLAALILPDPHVDYRIKLMEPFLKVMYWKCGLYGEGADFSRQCLDGLGMRVPPTGKARVDGVSSRDIQFPFALSKQTGWDGKLRARLFEPSDALDNPACKEEKLPLILYFHGGGFVLGSVDMQPFNDLCRILANRTRAFVLSVDYRLAPEHPFPNAIYDVYSAVSWVDRNLKPQQQQQQYDEEFFARVDPNKLVIAGDSAGGSLSVVATLVARDGVIHLPSGDKLPPTTVQPKYQVLIYPAIDREAKTRIPPPGQFTYVLNPNNMHFFTSAYVQDRSVFEPSHPHHHLFRHAGANLAHVPNALVIAAQHDPLYGEDKAFAAELKQAGIPSVTFEEFDSVHGFLTFFFLPECQRAINLIVDKIFENVGKPTCV